jgi:hypothetical protein
MSLWLSLDVRTRATDDNGRELYIKNEKGEMEALWETEEYHDQNITHNLGKMADAVKAGKWTLYQLLWRPEEHDFVTLTPEYVEAIREGYEELSAHPEKYEQYNSSNGWGLYEHFVPWVKKWLDAISDIPADEMKNYTIYASR